MFLVLFARLCVRTLGHVVWLCDTWAGSCVRSCDEKWCFGCHCVVSCACAHRSGYYPMSTDRGAAAAEASATAAIGVALDDISMTFRCAGCNGSGARVALRWWWLHGWLSHACECSLRVRFLRFCHT